MEIQKLFLFLFLAFSDLFLFSPLAESKAGSHGRIHGIHPEKLFAFGDSYADTGNTPNMSAFSVSWYFPFGITFPGKPIGRYSDGRVLTDFLAKFLGLKSPVPYRMRKYAPKRLLENGMNFAYGGSGLFGAMNMTTQIDEFQTLVAGTGSLFTKGGLQRSLALVTVAGNDYFTRNVSAEDLPTFAGRAVTQLALNLKRIHSLGVQRVAVSTMPPIGCYPRSTVANSFQHCNETSNAAATLHNHLLRQAVAKLNRQSKESSPFIILDLYGSFMSIIDGRPSHLGTGKKFETPLKGCCMGTRSQSFCGMMDEQGNKMYTLCSIPGVAFFWDAVHPTQDGWRAVFEALKPTISALA